MYSAVPEPAGDRRRPPAPPPTAVGLHDTPSPWQPLRVLVVESERDDQLLVWLARGAAVGSVMRSTPSGACATLHNAPVDVVILVAGSTWPSSPWRDLVHACQELRRLTGPRTSFLLLGRAGETRGRRAARKLGADMFVARPASSETLLEALATVLARRGFGA